MDRNKTDWKRTDDGVGTRGMEDLVLQVRGRSLAGSKVGPRKSSSAVPKFLVLLLEKGHMTMT